MKIPAQKKLMSILCVFSFFLVLFASQSILVTPAHADDGGWFHWGDDEHGGGKTTTPTCTTETLPVTLFQGDTTTYNVNASLCTIGSITGKTVQVLANGDTFGSYYWTLTNSGIGNSYNQVAGSSSYATLLYDKLGTGKSDKPNPQLLTVQTDSFVLHQIVQALKTGTFHTTFSKVVIVGHSLGAAVGVAEASTYTDIDGLVITGFLNTLNNGGSPYTLTNLYPASQDPKFSASNPDNGYWTSKPGTRAGMFFYPSNVSNSILTQDEAGKEMVSIGELATFYPAVFSQLSNQITVPILIVIGDNDNYYCGTGSLVTCSDMTSVQTYEKNFYSKASVLNVIVAKNSGHAILLQNGASVVSTSINQWITKNIGTGGSTQTGGNGCGDDKHNSGNDKGWWWF